MKKSYIEKCQEASEKLKEKENKDERVSVEKMKETIRKNKDLYTKILEDKKIRKRKSKQEQDNFDVKLENEDNFNLEDEKDRKSVDNYSFTVKDDIEYEDWLKSLRKIEEKNTMLNDSLILELQEDERDYLYEISVKFYEQLGTKIIREEDLKLGITRQKFREFLNKYIETIFNKENANPGFYDNFHKKNYNDCIFLKMLNTKYKIGANFNLLDSDY